MTLNLITAKGETLPLTGNRYFRLSNIDGLTEASVSISSSTVGGMDGDFVNDTRVVPRSVILDLAMQGNVEEAKRYVLRFVKPKQKVILSLEQNGRTTELEGVVEAIEMPRWSIPVTMQVTIYCSQPFWQDAQYTVQDISEVIDLHYFTDREDDMLFFPDEGIPFGEYDANKTKVFTNEGDVAVGLEIHIVALGPVKNPVIYNSKAEFLGVDIDMEAGDEIIATTEKGNKTLRLNGQNVLGKLRERSTWLQLEPGEDEFTIASDSALDSNMYFTVSYKQRYV